MRFALPLRDITRWPGLRAHARRVLAFCIAFGIATALFVPVFGHAADPETHTKLAGIIASTLSFFVAALGKLLLGIIYILTWVAQYNNFVNSAAITNGWVISRDVANMFFIVVLLIAAFGTILNRSEYNWKSMLPQLV